ncbi:hypothetical protein GY45DRAFT_1321599 [Cubamyces sp. BRFM 1775]|nr:hypothetical protein GY45DRAFT_1321599 [Cubamyces sp. BRFM 1775]
MGRILHRRASGSRRKKTSSAESASSTKPGKPQSPVPAPIFPPSSLKPRPNTRAASRQSTESGGSGASKS